MEAGVVSSLVVSCAGRVGGGGVAAVSFLFLQLNHERLTDVCTQDLGVKGRITEAETGRACSKVCGDVGGGMGVEGGLSGTGREQRKGGSRV